VHIKDVRRTMPTIIAYDIVGVSPFKGPEGLISDLKEQFPFAGGDKGSTGVLGRMELSGSERRYREED